MSNIFFLKKRFASRRSDFLLATRGCQEFLAWSGTFAAGIGRECGERTLVAPLDGRWTAVRISELVSTLRGLESAMPRRFLFGPVSGHFADQNLFALRADGRCRAFGFAGGVDLPL
jgi:hypothetical protein